MGGITFDFDGKVALITGAGSGIGEETALKFAANGASIMISDINTESCKDLLSRIQDYGGEAAFFPCDVSDNGQVEALVTQVIAKFGRLDIACNNAGIEGEQGVTAMGSEDNFNRVTATNTKGVWLCMKYEIPQLIKNGGGAIVNLSSIAGLIGFPGLSAYVASKHAVAGLTKTAALEYAESNIRVNAICPGPIMTPMLERLMETTPGFREKVIAGVPEHRIGSPADVANIILYLCTDQASYITGQCLAVDGGWVAQ